MKRSLVVIFISLASFCCFQNASTKHCNISFRCSNQEKPIWATTTGQNCLVYRNGCHLLKANCDRVNRNLPEAIAIDKDICQPLCGNTCPLIVAPVCAISEGMQMQTFSNLCEMENYACRTGLTYNVFLAEACPEPLKDKS